MRCIPLTKGYVAMVDDEDYEEISKYRWQALVDKSGRAVYAVRGAAGRIVSMHRIITGAARGQMVDHKNHCGIDNRRDNLRICTREQNARNRLISRFKGRPLKFKGIYFDPDPERKALPWRARIKMNKKSRHIGWFATQEEAARAYDIAAVRLFGEFACTNYDRLESNS